MASKLIGEAALQRRLEAIKKPKAGMWEIQKRAVKEAKDRVPRKTGNLGRSIVPGALTGSSAIIEVRSSYAAFVEFDTKPHTIRAKPGKVLAWPANASGRRLSGRARTNSGRMIFARSVKHPGTKAQPFLVPGAVEALRSVGIEALVIKPWNGAA